MDLFPDFRDLLAAFDDSGARYVVVGGYAVIFHGRPRATKDLDLLVAVDDDNRGKVAEALASFGAPASIIALGDLIANKRASGRPRDLEDCAELERIAARRGT